MGRAGAIALGISGGGADCGEKMFRPTPEYCSDSLTSIASMCSVGSSAESLVCFFGLLLELGCRRAGAAVLVVDAAGEACGVLVGVPVENSWI